MSVRVAVAGAVAVGEGAAVVAVGAGTGLEGGGQLPRQVQVGVAVADTGLDHGALRPLIEGGDDGPIGAGAGDAGEEPLELPSSRLRT